LAAIDADGHANGPYVHLESRSDPTAGMIWDVAQPRYSSGYFPLRNRVSILIEMHAHKPYRDRVLANRAFIDELMEETGRSGPELVAATVKAENATVALGASGADPSDVVVRWGVAEKGEKIIWPACGWSLEHSIVMGGDRVKFLDGITHEVELEWRHLPVAEQTVARPRGYLVLAGWPQIEDLVSGHGLRASRLTAAVELDVETIRLSAPGFASSSYQGVVMVEDFKVSRQHESRSIPAGSLWIPADQPSFEIAVQLFEPEAPDSIVRWGTVSSVFERKIYIGLDLLEELVEEMLKDDAVRNEWEKALEDSEFASNPRARYIWWYRRTAYWDETVGLLPVMRVMAPPRLELEPWPMN
jgi:hypothetical protein